MVPIGGVIDIGIRKGPVMRAIALVAPFAFAVIAIVGTAQAAPATKTYCGLRTGTSGNAELSKPNGDTVIELAQQGGDQTLLDQADALVPDDASGEQGTQYGTNYCVTAQLDAAGKPVKITKAWRAP